MNFIDAHVHVRTPDVVRYPLAPGVRTEDVPVFSPDDWFAHARPVGVTRAVLIQLRGYGFDNSYMLDVIAAHPGTFVGTAVIEVAGTLRVPSASPRGNSAPRGEANGTRSVPATMASLAAQGVRAFRIHPALSPEPVERWLRPAGFQEMFAAAADTNQAMACLVDPIGLPEVDRMCREHPRTPVIIDHLARIGLDGEIRPADVAALVSLARHPRVMVKVGALYALGAKRSPYTDLTDLIAAVVRAFGPERCMWESDCPFQVMDGHRYADSIDLIGRLDCLSAADRECLLRTTAGRFFFA